MRIQYPKLRNMTHALSLSVSISFKGTNFYILSTTITFGSQNGFLAVTKHCHKTKNLTQTFISVRHEIRHYNYGV